MYLFKLMNKFNVNLSPTIFFIPYAMEVNIIFTQNKKILGENNRLYYQMIDVDLFIPH